MNCAALDSYLAGHGYMLCPNTACGWAGPQSDTVPYRAEPGGHEFPPDHLVHDARFCPECGTQVEFAPV